MYTKLTGALIIIVTSVILAIDIIKNMHLKQDAVYQWQCFFEMTGSVLASGNTDIVQAMENAADVKSKPVWEVVHSLCSKLMQADSISLADAWSEYITNSDKAIDEKLRGVIADFTANISNTDVNICIKSARDAATRLREYADELKIYNRQNKKLVVCSAISAGLFVVILLI